MRQRRGSHGLKPRLQRLAALAACLACALVHAQAITVFAAASLKEALDAAVRPFEAASGHRVVVSYAGSNVLARQIAAGAPAALFISADEDWMNAVMAQGRAVAGSRRDLLANDLVLIAPASSQVQITMAPGVDIAHALGPGRLALANPDAVPAGRYAKAALMALGAWNGVRDRIAPAENVRAALALVARGEAALGIVYRTDALAEPHVRVVATFPAASHPPIVYPMVQLKDAPPGTGELAAHLASPAARGVWERFGFRLAS
jgi:molybdate transport system substrate-binding protein